MDKQQLLETMKIEIVRAMTAFDGNVHLKALNKFQRCKEDWIGLENINIIGDDTIKYIPNNRIIWSMVDPEVVEKMERRGEKIIEIDFI